MDKQTAERLETAFAIIRDNCGRKRVCIDCTFYALEKGDTLCKLRNYDPEHWEDEWIEVDEDDE